MTAFLSILIGVPILVGYVLLLVSFIVFVEEETGNRVWPGLLVLWLLLVVPIAAFASFCT